MWMLLIAVSLVVGALSAWLGWTYGYRRGIDVTTEAHRQARDDFHETMEIVSRYPGGRPWRRVK
jgi:hypothetical protein